MNQNDEEMRESIEFFSSLEESGDKSNENSSCFVWALIIVVSVFLYYFLSFFS